MAHILYDQTRRMPIVIPVINEIGVGVKSNNGNKPGQPERKQQVPFKLPSSPKIPPKQYPDVETLEPRHRSNAESRGY